MYPKLIKPALDFLTALCGLIILSPIFLILCLILALNLKGNPFFVQERPGKNGRIFKLIKFRTMNNKKDSNGDLLPDSERLSPVGKIVRKTSLDEIPQLLNILIGQMSLIGPRPLLVEYLPLYSKEQNRRHAVRPGITGWAQINGRNAISWKEKFEYDIWYVDHISLSLDIKILFLTFIIAIKREGINSAGMATTEKFKGNN